MITIYNKLLSMAETQSDIREHMFTLLGYSLHCDHITEMGVRDVISTWAFLAANPKKLVSIDITYSPNIEEAKVLAKEANIEFEFLQQDTIARDFNIEKTDLLFIDTLHTYPQLKQELNQHANNVSKYIIMHDTTTFGFINESNIFSSPKQGLRAAVIEFLEENDNWMLINSYEHNNGLGILKRIL